MEEREDINEETSRTLLRSRKGLDLYEVDSVNTLFKELEKEGKMKALIGLLRSSKGIIIALVVGVGISWAVAKLSESDNPALKKAAELVKEREGEIKKALDDAADDAIDSLENKEDS